MTGAPRNGPFVGLSRPRPDQPACERPACEAHDRKAYTQAREPVPEQKDRPLPNQKDDGKNGNPKP
jgi:hypothetical protein